MTPATPAVNRSASGTATAKSSARRLVPSAARIAASDMALPASVPPIPLTSIDGSSKSARTAAASAALRP